jgi:hypothetical protein
MDLPDMGTVPVLSEVLSHDCQLLAYAIAQQQDSGGAMGGETGLIESGVRPHVPADRSQLHWRTETCRYHQARCWVLRRTLGIKPTSLLQLY